MKIIGHRGAAGLAPENTLSSIRSAIKARVDEIEIDLRLTKDKRVVLMHRHVFLPARDLGSLKEVRHAAKQQIVTLEEALDVIGDYPTILDVKDQSMAAEIAMIIKQYPKARISFASFLHDELRALRELLPGVEVYVLDHFSPIDIISNALRLGADGVGLNKWLMNPLTYRLARRHRLKLYVYTVNSRLLAHLFQRLYPEIAICTNHPNRILRLQK